MVKALIVSNNEIDQSVKDQVEKKINSCTVDPGASAVVRQKTCLIEVKGIDDDERTGGAGNGAGFEIPKTDIVANLPSDCLTRMVRLFLKSVTNLSRLYHIYLLTIWSPHHRI